MLEFFIEHEEKMKEALWSIVQSDNSLYFNKFLKIIFIIIIALNSTTCS